VTGRPDAHRTTLARRSAIVAALLVALLGGWLWGASGRSELVRARRSAELARDLVEARASLLEARVSLGDANFGQVTRQLRHARGSLGRANAGLSAAGADDVNRRLELASLLAGIDEAQRLVEAAASTDADPLRPAKARVVSTEPSRAP